MNVNERKSRPKLKCETHSIRRKNLQKVKSQISGFSQQELALKQANPVYFLKVGRTGFFGAADSCQPPAA
jgi:hypothetical protein